MPAVDLTEKVKEKLELFKDKEGCKTYSEAVNLLLQYYDLHHQDTRDSSKND
ncbi:MAG: hypothetical protein ACFFAO_19615 [Candidatus Hermodarchaeota archaeon]